MLSRLIAVDGVHGKGRETDRDVFCAAFVGSGVADPLAGLGDDGLSGEDVERTILVFNVESAFKDNGELVEGRGLPRLEPSSGAAHVSDASGRGLGVDASYVFIDEFWFVAGGLDACRLRDQSGHG